MIAFVNFIFRLFYFRDILVYEKRIRIIFNSYIRLWIIQNRLTGPRNFIAERHDMQYWYINSPENKKYRK